MCKLKKISNAPKEGSKEVEDEDEDPGGPAVDAEHCSEEQSEPKKRKAEAAAEDGAQNTSLCKERGTVGSRGRGF